MTPPVPVEDIHDIRAPIAIPELLRWSLIAAGILLAVVAIALVVRWVIKRRARPLTPREEALAALQRAEALAIEGRAREWADVVAETVRAALSVRLGHAILPQTTSELRTGFGSSTPALDEAPRVLELLEDCDLARFARASLDRPALVERTAAARTLVLPLFDPVPQKPTNPPVPA